jgi:quinoprotein glucose dehydrogenase
MKKTGLMVGAALVVTGAWLQVAVNAQGKTAAAGIYTAAQAKAGAAVYTAKCSACHGANLEGMGPMPPLSGTDFLATWSGETVGDLFDKTKATMPATDPGSLTPEEAANVMAHILSTNKYPAGSAALASDVAALKAIKLGSPK